MGSTGRASIAFFYSHIEKINPIINSVSVKYGNKIKNEGVTYGNKIKNEGVTYENKNKK